MIDVSNVQDGLNLRQTGVAVELYIRTTYSKEMTLAVTGRKGVTSGQATPEMRIVRCWFSSSCKYGLCLIPALE